MKKIKFGRRRKKIGFPTLINFLAQEVNSINFSSTTKSLIRLNHAQLKRWHSVHVRCYCYAGYAVGWGIDEFYGNDEEIIQIDENRIKIHKWKSMISQRSLHWQCGCESRTHNGHAKFIAFDNFSRDWFQCELHKHVMLNGRYGLFTAIRRLFFLFIFRFRKQPSHISIQQSTWQSLLCVNHRWQKLFFICRQVIG